MEEQPVSFKVAKLAKEKGFDVEFIEVVNAQIYDSKKELSKYNYYMYGFSLKELEESEESLYLAPTQSLLQKWLREVHNIIVKPVDCLLGLYNIEYEVEIYDVNNHKIIRHNSISKVSFKTYEQALEKGLFQALKLIEDEKV